MVSLLTVEEIYKAEERAMKNGVSRDTMCYNAALAVVDCVTANYKPNDEEDGVSVFIGRGGNGYDGVIVAGRLKSLGYDVRCFSVYDKSTLSDRIKTIAKVWGVEILPISKFDFRAIAIVDAIFGIGLNRPITDEEALKAISIINSCEESRVFSIDVPSGLNADTGDIMGDCVIAHMTVTFTAYKYGFLMGSGFDLCGKVYFADVGVPASGIATVYTDSDYKTVKRKRASHKGDYGKVFIIGGSGTMVGAPILASKSAFSCFLNGCGTVTICIPEYMRIGVTSRAEYAMMQFMPDTVKGFIKFNKRILDDIMSKASSIGIGMGMGATPDLKKILHYLVSEYTGTLVIDADALNAIALDYDFLSNTKAKIAVTPHVKEFERLTGLKANAQNAMEFSRRTGAITVLKSAASIITDGKTFRVNNHGTPGMAKGGSGDLLVGCICGLSGTYKSLYDAATAACYRNGVGAERAVKAYAEIVLTPREIVRFGQYVQFENDYIFKI